MSETRKLFELGQSLWYDNIQRSLLESGELASMVDRGDIYGVTSNPTIFNTAISKSSDYDSALQPLAWAGWNARDIFYQLAVEDIQAAADLFRPVYERTDALDGYVSLEVSPYLAHDTKATIHEAKNLWKRVNRPNLMIKIPATPEGIPAIKKSLAAGINVNVTLIFSLERYREVMEAYIGALEERVAAGLPVERIASVASFFVSRLDTKVDALLLTMVEKGNSRAKNLMGKAALANTCLAYALFKDTFNTPRFERIQEQGARVQRPLWASTSTKNPNYYDLIYVDKLIAPHTVNTVPPKTLEAFRDHGTAKLTLEGNEEESRIVLQNIEGLGFSLEKLTSELESEGVKSFSDSFTALLGSIEERRKNSLAGLGVLKKAVKSRIRALESDLTVQRLFAHDARLWTNDPIGQEEVIKRLGWLDAPGKGRILLQELIKLVQEIFTEGYTHVCLLGMGGSSLAPEVLALSQKSIPNSPPSPVQFSILDSTDPGQVRDTSSALPVQNTLFIVASKSGGTSEVNAFFNYFWQTAVNVCGNNAGQHFIAITDPGTSLEVLARRHGFRRIIQADPAVGGRYSALTVFGLVPALLLNLDVTELLKRAEWMAAQCSPNLPASRNPGLALGAFIGEAAKQGRDKLTILADPEVHAFGSWLEQLIAESSGKQGKGIIPIDMEPALPPEEYSQDRLFVYIKFSGASSHQADQLISIGQPLITLPLQSINDLGAEFYRWEVAIAIATSILGVNGFDQPDVQDSKTRTERKIAIFLESGRLDEGKPIWQKGKDAVYGETLPGMEKAENLAEIVDTFLDQNRPGDYIAINAYVPRNPDNLASLQEIRKRILMKTRIATTLGFGPRFLHSTGQLHKGGPDSGLFLQITVDHEKTDLPIPNRGMSFATLQRAQALGDLEALTARGKRVIRIHLGQSDLRDLVF